MAVYLVEILYLFCELIMSTLLNTENQSVISFCGENVTVTVDGVKTWKHLVDENRDYLGITASEVDQLNFFAGSDIINPLAIAIPAKSVIASFAHEEKGLG